jgi:murein DD-endopeptidase MepM/ murein hydrolase activator NlpD
MKHVKQVAAATLILGVLASSDRMPLASTLMLDVSHHARALQPGEVVVLEVRPSAPSVLIYATAFSNSIKFFPDASNGLWRGLVGIDLDTSPGEYLVALRATDHEGRTAHTTYMLHVEGKEFPTRRLNVSPSFVNPPDDVLDRIRREASSLAAIFRNSDTDRQWNRGFIAPVPGESTSSFGRRSVYNGEVRSPHSGTDFRAVEGTAVKAPNAATVALTGDLYFSGKVIILDHGWGLYSYFAHLSSFDVAQGDVVTQGETVGRVGATGRVTGPHLHWTVRLNGARVDPLSLMLLLPD